MNPLLRCFAVLPAMLAAAVLTGCAAPVTHHDMVPVAAAVAKPHPQSVTVTVSAAPGAKQVMMTDLHAALDEALVGYRVFAATAPDGGDYLLNVQVIDMSSPAFGAPFVTHLVLDWTLTRAANGAVVWHESIASDYKVEGTEVASAGKLKAKSNAGAIRVNLRDGLQRIGTLAL